MANRRPYGRNRGRGSWGRRAPDNANTNGDQQTPICRNFVWGTCTKQPHCKFRHEYDIEEMKKIIQFCHDFQNRGICQREECTFLHTSREEEILFLSQGIIPKSLAERHAQMNATASSNNEGAETIPQIASFIRESYASQPLGGTTVGVSVAPPPPPPPPPLSQPETAGSSQLSANNSIAAQPSVAMISVVPPPPPPPPTTAQQTTPSYIATVNTTYASSTSNAYYNQPPTSTNYYQQQTTSSYQQVFSQNSNAGMYAVRPTMNNHTAVSEHPSLMNSSQRPSAPTTLPTGFDPSRPPPLPSTVLNNTRRRPTDNAEAGPNKIRRADDGDGRPLCFNCAQGEQRIRQCKDRIVYLETEEESRLVTLKKKLEDFLSTKEAIRRLVSPELFRVIEEYVDGTQHMNLHDFLSQIGQPPGMSGSNKLLLNLVQHVLDGSRMAPRPDDSFMTALQSLFNPIRVPPPVSNPSNMEHLRTLLDMLQNANPEPRSQQPQQPTVQQIEYNEMARHQPPNVNNNAVARYNGQQDMQVDNYNYYPGLGVPGPSGMCVGALPGQAATPSSSANYAIAAPPPNFPAVASAHVTGPSGLATASVGVEVPTNGYDQFQGPSNSMRQYYTQQYTAAAATASNDAHNINIYCNIQNRPTNQPPPPQPAVRPPVTQAQQIQQNYNYMPPGYPPQPPYYPPYQ